MVLFAILLLTLMLLITFIVVITGLGGAIFIIIFGDVIVCIFLIMALIRLIYKKKK